MHMMKIQEDQKLDTYFYLGKKKKSNIFGNHKFKRMLLFLLLKPDFFF